MNNKLSIIMPVYNAEHNLRRSLDSILLQNYQNFEVLLVNDGSTDYTEEVCLEYVRNDSDRFRYFKQKNLGPGAARNLALKNAKGEYLVFIDSDDTIESGYFTDVIDTFKKWDGNVIQYGYNLVDSSLNKKRTSVSSKIKILRESENIVYEYGKGQNIDMFLWSKAFRRESLTDHFFAHLYYAEDQLFLIKYFYDIDQILILDRCYYNYILSENSLVRSSFNVTKMDGIIAARKMFDVHKENCKINACFASEKICYYISTMFIHLYQTKKEKQKIYDEFEYHYHILRDSYKRCDIPKKRKILYCCFYYFPLLSSKLADLMLSLKRSNL